MGVIDLQLEKTFKGCHKRGTTQPLHMVYTLHKISFYELLCYDGDKFNIYECEKGLQSLLMKIEVGGRGL